MKNNNKEISLLIEETGIGLCRWLEESFKRLDNKKWYQEYVVPYLDNKSKNINKIEELDLQAILKVTYKNIEIISKLYETFTDIKTLKKIIRNMMQFRNKVIAHVPIKNSNSIKQQSILYIYAAEFCKMIGLDVLSSQYIEISENYKKVSISKLSKEARNLWIPEDIPSAFDNNELTCSQEMAYNKIINFINDPNKQCFILNGFAGTGKTFIIQGLLRLLNSCNINTKVLAPTGRAASIFNTQYGVESSTIHKCIYEYKNLETKNKINEEEELNHQMFFGIKDRKENDSSIYIVDEASMLSNNNNNKQDLSFGTGNLMNDLFNYVNFFEDVPIKKVIFVGDNCQLPPIGMSKSPALSKDTILEEYNLETEEATLTDILRQKESSFILKNAMNLRDQIVLTDNKPDFKFICNNKEVFDITNEDLTNKFTKKWLERMDKQIILAYSNSQVSGYNKIIRNRLFVNPKILEINDKLMITRNNYKYFDKIYNGQFATVVETFKETKQHSVIIRTKSNNLEESKTKKIELTFGKVKLSFQNKSKDNQPQTYLFLEESLCSNSADLETEIENGLFVDFKNRMKIDGITEKDKIFREKMKTDYFYNALRFKYGYAVTCHKAQGGEWDKVFVDFTNKNNLSIKDNSQWSYTATTRAKKQLYIINPPEKRILEPKDTIVYRHNKKNQRIVTSNIPVITNNKENDFNLPIWIKNEDDFSKEVYLTLKIVLEDKLKIVGFLKKQYELLYQIEIENHNYGEISVRYNKKHKISSAICRINSNHQLQEKINENIEFFKNNEDFNGEIKINKELLKLRFFENLIIKLKLKKINIIRLKEISVYHREIVCTKNESTASMILHFQKGNKFSRCETFSNNDLELEKEIFTIINVKG